MKNQKRKKLTKDKKELYSIIETVIDTETVVKIIEDNYYEKAMREVDNTNVDINHLENIFTNETYYLAMKIVPLLERKVLYLSYIENARLDDIYRRLKLERREVIHLRHNAIIHFKNNLRTLCKTNKLKKGGDLK